MGDAYQTQLDEWDGDSTFAGFANNHRFRYQTVVKGKMQERKRLKEIVK